MLQAVVDVGGGGSGLYFRERRSPGYPAVKPVEPDLKLLLQSCQHAVLQRLFRRSFPRKLAVAVGNRHAARIIEHNRDYVLLRRQLGHGDRGLPKQHQHGGDEQRLQQPDQRLHATYLCSARPAAAATG